jgi:hypothetical protein
MLKSPLAKAFLMELIRQLAAQGIRAADDQEQDSQRVSAFLGRPLGAPDGEGRNERNELFWRFLRIREALNCRSAGMSAVELAAIGRAASACMLLVATKAIACEVERVKRRSGWAIEIALDEELVTAVIVVALFGGHVEFNGTELSDSNHVYELRPSYAGDAIEEGFAREMYCHLFRHDPETVAVRAGRPLTDRDYGDIEARIRTIKARTTKAIAFVLGRKAGTASIHSAVGAASVLDTPTRAQRNALAGLGVSLEVPVVMFSDKDVGPVVTLMTGIEPRHLTGEIREFLREIKQHGFQP